MRRSMALALVLPAALLWGCTDVAGLLNTPISLTATEVNQLMTEIVDVFDTEGVTFDHAAPSLSLSRVPAILLGRQGSITDSIDCVRGGTAIFTGSFSGQTGDVTVTFTGCLTAHYTIDGAFRITESSTTTTQTQTGAGDLTLKASGDRSGTCHIDFTVTRSGSTTTPTGTVCGTSATSIGVLTG